jgi:methionyl-tRNA formyltransferase
MRILFVGGLCRGFRLAERLVARGEELVGALVYQEDSHESDQYADRIVESLAPRVAYVRKTRKITRDLLPEIRDRLAPDVIFCLGWRTLIPPEVIACAPRGGVAVHDSLLPRLRGFAPTNWGLILGHDQLGATLFQLTDSVDAGNIYFQQAITPQPQETYESIQNRIADVSVDLFLQYLDAAQSGTLTSRPQREADATYTCARIPADGEIDWRQSSQAIAQLVRALAPPAPPAFTHHHGEVLAIHRASAVENPRNYAGRIPGRVIERDPARGTVDVLCGTGILRVESVQTSAGKVRAAADVLRSVRESLGLNHSQEISDLRARLAVLEAQLAALSAAPARRQSA